MYLVFWLQDRELASVEMQDAAQVTAADFTVRIIKLPSAYNKATSDALREELKQHFEKALGNIENGFVDPPPDAPKPLESPALLSTPEETVVYGDRVAAAAAEVAESEASTATTSVDDQGHTTIVRVLDVNFGYNDHEVLRATKARGVIARKLDLAMTKVIKIKRSTEIKIMNPSPSCAP